MRRLLVAVFVVARFVVDIVAVFVFVTFVVRVRFVIMVVIVILVRNSAGLVSPGDQSSSQADLVVRQHSRREAQALYPVNKRNRNFSVSLKIEANQCYLIELKVVFDAVVNS